MPTVPIDTPDDLPAFTQGRKRLEQMLLDGLHSAPTEPATLEYIERKKAALTKCRQKAYV